MVCLDNIHGEGGMYVRGESEVCLETEYSKCYDGKFKHEIHRKFGLFLVFTKYVLK